MQAGTRNIYYLCAPSRHLAEHSPYYEAMKRKNTEVGELGPLHLFSSLARSEGRGPEP